MTSLYLGLALTIAATVNAPWAWLRALGNLIAAGAMAMMAWSIVLANRDGTFAAVAPTNSTPAILNGIAVVLGVGVLLLLIGVPRQFRHDGGKVPPRSTPFAHGHITRALHWASATLVIAAFTMGLFIAILPETRPERAEFLTAHMAIGGAVFLLTFARMFERLVRKSPPNTDVGHGTHFLLYALLVATSVTGLALATAPIKLLGLTLPNLPPEPIAAPLHHVVLPLLFLVLIALHLAGAVKAMRRMAR
jgi:cytochrome b561